MNPHHSKDGEPNETPQLWRDLKPGEMTREGDRIITIIDPPVGRGQGFILEKGMLPIQRAVIDPINWQARALAAEKQADFYKLEAEAYQLVCERVKRDLSASQAEVGRLRDVIERVDAGLADRGFGISSAERKLIAWSKLSPAEKGGGE